MKLPLWLSSVTQPFGFDLFNMGKKYLVYNITARNLKTKYRRSILGLGWTLLVPMAQAAIYYFVFQVVLSIQTPFYGVFLVVGILPWNFFAQSFLESLESIVGNQGLLSKVPVPVQTFPLTGTITNFVTLLLATPVVLGFAFASGLEPRVTWLYVPYFYGVLFLMTYSLALCAAVSFVYLRDLRLVAQIGIQILQYGTPILFQQSKIPERYQWIVSVNPFGHLFEGLHRSVIGYDQVHSIHFLAPAGWAVFLVFFSGLVGRLSQKGLVELL